MDIDIPAILAENERLKKAANEAYSALHDDAASIRAKAILAEALGYEPR